MRQDTIAVQGFLLECFLYEGYVHTWGGGGGGRPKSSWKVNKLMT